MEPIKRVVEFISSNSWMRELSGKKQRRRFDFMEGYFRKLIPETRL
jgi:hypothetical protein